MAKKKYNLHLKGYVGGWDFDADYVDYILGKNDGQEVNVLIDSLGGSVATALSISSAFRNHGNVNVHYVGMNASAATIASLGARHVSIDASAMYLVHKCSSLVFKFAQLNADELQSLIEECEQQKNDLQKIDLNIERVVTEKKLPLLEIRDLTVNNDENAVAIDHVNFYIRGGEILGVAGIAGCGQKELCEAIAGLRPVQSGKIIHEGENIIGFSPKRIIEKGISMSFIPEDRLGMGLAPSLSIVDNMLLKKYADSKGIFVDRVQGKADAEKVIKELGVVTPSANTPVRLLSGGNVQKVLLGREISSGPNVIVTAYPVRGLDINSSYAIYDILNAEKKKGTGILFVGEDLDVLLALCDKIMVLCHGKVMGIVHAHKTTKEEIGLMMTGALDYNEEKPFGIAKDSQIKDTPEAGGGKSE